MLHEGGVHPVSPLRSQENVTMNIIAHVLLLQGGGVFHRPQAPARPPRHHCRRATPHRELHSPHRAAEHSAHLARAVAVVFDDAARDHDAVPRHFVRVEDRLVLNGENF